MPEDTVPDELAAEVTRLVHERGKEIAAALGVRLGKPTSPKIGDEVRAVARYARGGGTDLSNDEICDSINSVIRTICDACYPPATLAARAIFERRAGDPESDIEVALLAARARWDIELGMDVPIRWLAALGGVSVKTARNLASAGQISTLTKGGYQVATAREAARWLLSRGTAIEVGSRHGHRHADRAARPAR
jgi:hypothetical protein